MSDVSSPTPETPFERARRLHAAGASAQQVEQALIAEGLEASDARIAARAARGESGAPFAAMEDRQVDELPAEPPAIAPTHPCPKHPAWPVRAPCGRCGTFYCTGCLRQAGLLSDSSRCPACHDERPQRQSIGGWLVLPALGLVVTPFVLGYGIFQDASALGSPLKSGLVPPIALELLVNLALLGLGLTAAVAFFKRQRRAVALMVAWYSAGLAVAVLDFGILGWVNSVVGKSDPAAGAASARSIITSLIWIAYFLQSKRVKATFIYE